MEINTTLFRLMVLSLTAAASYGCQSGLKSLSVHELRDRIKGGWAGQMIGVSFGAPTEFRFRGKIIPEDRLPSWSEERLQNALHQDDLYVEMTFARVLDDKGPEAKTEDFATMFRDSKYRLWHANLAARRALSRGVSGLESGSPRFNVHANDIDFQIESDFIGLMSPGLPESASDLCLRIGKIMNTGDGILGGVFVSSMYAAAFFESDPRRVVEAGYSALPPNSPYARTIRDVLDWSAETPADWTKVWKKLEEKWDSGEVCPAGALLPFNIDAKLNGAYVALGLLFGEGDFEKTLKIATRAGQDSDCNPSSACGVLGVMLGYEGIPERWKKGIEKVADQPFDYTDYSFNSIVQSTLNRALDLISRTGGQVDQDRVRIRPQAPRPAQVEIWDDFGSPVERISWDDSRWEWEGDWNHVSTVDPSARGAQQSAARGSEARVRFAGTGAILSGPLLPGGGIAEIVLDGRRTGLIDVDSDDQIPRRREALWHMFGLEDNEHELRVVVQGEPFRGDEGGEIAIQDLIVFRQTARRGSSRVALPGLAVAAEVLSPSRLQREYGNWGTNPEIDRPESNK